MGASLGGYLPGAADYAAMMMRENYRAVEQLHETLKALITLYPWYQRPVALGFSREDTL